MQNQTNASNDELLFQAMRIQEVATKAEFAATTLNNFLHTPYNLVFKNQDDVNILKQAQQILAKINSRDAFEKLAEQMI